MRKQGSLAVVLLCLLPIACSPYPQEGVSVTVNDDVTLAGTLSMPNGEGPYPAAILITGSGLQDRDCDVRGFKVFKKIAHHLSGRGIVVLRCDDRGFGESTGDPSAAANTTLDFADDVLAQVAYLTNRPEVDAGRIGLIGLSEGAMVAAMVDARSDDIEFAVLCGGPCLPARQGAGGQIAASMKRQGFDDAAIAARLDLWRRIYDAILNGGELLGLQEELRAALRADFERLPPEQLAQIPDVDRRVERIVSREFNTATTKWGMFLLTYDPLSDLLEMDSRVLALFGGKDTHVLADPNAVVLEEAFRKAGKENLEIKIFPDANHFFQKAVTGTAAEYDELPKEFIPGYLEELTDWVLDK